MSQTWFECYTIEEGGLAYARANRDLYINMALKIEPDREEASQVWDRAAFAILTAHCRFQTSVRGLHYAQTCRGRVMGRELCKVGGGMTQTKAGWLNCLPWRNVKPLLKGVGETWQAYRSRLIHLRGLRMTKASFAACLLYPFDADICCLDVWMLRGLCVQAPKRLAQYEVLESRVRSLARGADLPLFLMQWALWDWLRGRVETHDIWEEESTCLTE